MNYLKLFFNWARIKWHKHVTGRVTTIVVNDKETGKSHEVTVEQHVEDVCAHKNIREVTHTLWQCTTPDCDTYFQINYKVMITQPELVRYLQDIANHLKVQVGKDDHA